MKFSARNQLKGKVIEINEGAINSEIVIQIAPGVEVVSIITKASQAALGLTVGKEAYALIKASSVMIATE